LPDDALWCAALALKDTDARMHFALVRGSLACPPWRIWAPNNFEKGTRLVHA
jgi:hypothetical protein